MICLVSWFVAPSCRRHLRSLKTRQPPLKAMEDWLLDTTRNWSMGWFKKKKKTVISGDVRVCIYIYITIYIYMYVYVLYYI